MLGGWIAGKTFLITQPGQGFPGNRNDQMIISKIRDIDAGVSAFKQKKPRKQKNTLSRQIVQEAVSFTTVFFYHQITIMHRVSGIVKDFPEQV